MSPTTKQYKITSQFGGRVIARFPREDRSALPKPIAELPKDTDEPRTWEIEQIAGGEYKLKNGGAVVGAQSDDLVWAFLREVDVQCAEWKITPAPRHGPNAYIIETTGKCAGKAWTASDEDNAQVSVKPIPFVGMSFPPTYPPNVVFDIVSVPESDESAQA